jgi:alpha-tubulin suppressor-like RCC1 family protein
MRPANVLVPGLLLLAACIMGEAEVTSVDSVAAGPTYSCATTSEGRLYCWGKWPRVAMTGPLAVTGVEIGQTATCGILAGKGAICWGGAPDPQTIRPDLRFRQVSVGDYACGVTTAGAVHCWTPPSATTQEIVGVEGATEVAAWGGRTCVTIPAVGVRCWNAIGTPIYAVAGTNGITYHGLTLGTLHGCALDADGIARCWGGNSAGQLGNGNFAISTVPTTVLWGDRPSASDLFVELSAGADFTCGVTQSHGGFCWGQGVPYPAVIPLIDSWVTVRAGAEHACGVARDDRWAYCWGANQYGQLGTGDTVAYDGPSRVRLP